MSKMKHLLRKLHIGKHHYNTASARPNSNNRTQSEESSSSSSSSPPSVSSSTDQLRTARESQSAATIVENVGVDVDRENINRSDFNLIEEDFQLQLAMAISASGSENQIDDDSDKQIMAAKQLSLACSPSVPDNEKLSEFLSLKYWVSFSSILGFLIVFSNLIGF